MRRPYTLEAPPTRSALICSDLHCRRGKPCRQLADAASLASRLGAECLVLAGDLFEDLHEPTGREALLRELDAILGPTETPRLVVYVTSLSSHDPILQGPVYAELHGSKLIVVPGMTVLHVSGRRICVLHGDAAVPNGALAHIVNRLAALLGRPLYLERRMREKLCPDGLLIAGHTHIPGLLPDRGVGNPGSWKTLWRRGLPYWRRPSRTCIYVAEGVVRLVEAKV